MKTIAIHISGGNVHGIYEVENSPHTNIIIMDDDAIQGALDRVKEAKDQLEGFEIDGYMDFKDIHSELSRYISSEEVNS